jgi:cell division protein FtsB
LSVTALTLVPSTALPPARRALVALNDKIERASRHLATLSNGRDQLRAELSRASSARDALDAMVAEDASSLARKLRSGASWALSHFGSLKAMNLVAQLSESGLQRQVGEKALAEIEAEIAVAEREVSDLKSGKADLVRSALIESADGARADALVAIEHLREALVIRAGLDRITARSDGSWAPNDRIVIEIPPLGGLPAQAVVVPAGSIEKALRVWAKYSQALSENPLAPADGMQFPPVDPNADDGTILYDRMTRTERARVDQSRASGV